MSESDADLRAVSITAGYDGPPILDGVSVEVSRGKMAVILGPNGAGKSTLAKAILGQISVSKGSVHFRGEDVTGMGAHKLVRRGLAYLPQLMNTFDEMSVIENLEMGGFTIKKGLAARIDQVLELFPDLAQDRKKKAMALSGGQQRMLAMARMLMTEPVVAILDEPTSGLSPLYADRVWEQTQRIRELGVGLLVVEQNAQAAVDHADTVFVLAQGRNVLSGEAEEIRGRDEMTSILVG